MLSRGRNPEPKLSGKHSGKEKQPFNRKKPGAGPGLHPAEDVSRRMQEREMASENTYKHTRSNI